MSTPETRRGRWALWLPLALFAVFVALVVIGLYRPDDRVVESHMVGKPLPEFALPAAAENRPGLASQDFRTGKPRLLNIFASWCLPCAAEAPVLDELRRQGVEIDGVAVRDHRADLAAFLERHGNPYARIGADEVSAVQLAIGSSGYPETFVIDGQGVIRYQHVGVIMPGQIPMILAKLEEAAR
jgi:cytochrome c biogenesis protein CcmG, thiol:disulfide interchange protein DsbE